VTVSNEVRVVVAAGGLGTRVHHWARYLPKEFYPVGDRPGIAWLLEEIAGLGEARVVIVYHPAPTISRPLVIYTSCSPTTSTSGRIRCSRCTIYLLVRWP
jgi:2-C-methyl-D-erythritol 4-phosphate cytidylyltransferase